MRIFIVLSLAAIAYADSLGYNYQPVAHASGSGILTSPYSASNSAPTYAAPSNSVPAYAAPFNAAPSFAAPSNAAPSYAAPSYAAPSNAAPSYAAPAELNKEFYTYSANDEDFNDPAASNEVSQSLKKNLRVIFIKGPENKGLEKAALSLAKHANEQQTAIYVLQKQTDIGELANKLNVVQNSNNNKPEVHFVKYRTAEDAANAQRQIQSQYNALEGTSQSHDGGVAPVLNFASSAPAPVRSYAPAPHAQSFAPQASAPVQSYATQASAPAQSYVPAEESHQASAPSTSYLPASLFRTLRI